MEVSETSLSVFYVCKCLALAPISIRTNGKGAIEIRRSILFTIYSFTFGFIMVILAYRDALSGSSLKFPSLLTSETLKLVLMLDLTAVALTSCACIGCGLFSVKATRKLNLHLKKFDDVMYGVTNFKRDRIISRIMATIPLTLGAMIIALDVCVMAIQNESRNEKEVNDSFYMPFYILYFIIFGFQVLYANTAFGLSRRFRRLNILLSDYLPANKFNIINKTNKIRPQTNYRDHSNVQQVFEKNDVIARVDLLKTIAKNYESLCICAEIFSNTFGLAVLFILVSCMLHTVATSYFLFLAALDGKDTVYMCVQSIWILYHVMRVLLVVEPCHMAATEGKKTIQLVAEIDRKIYDPVLAVEVKRFWKQLLISNTGITAMGLCSIDRYLLTSFSSSITTYLVILIQFQKVDH